MSENGRKRSRKSKLVPRDCGDDDCFLQEPPKKKTLLEKIKSDSGGMSTSTAPLQFSVKVEVEDINNPSEEDPSDYMKYLFSLSTSTPDKTESMVTPSTITTSTARKSLDEIDPPESPEDSMPYDETAYYLHPIKMFKMFPLLNKKYPDDKEAVMHCRNLWGKVFHELGYHDIRPTAQEKELQNALNEWRTWQVTSKTRDSPFCYKCYICTDAWWSYTDFRNHIRVHPSASLNLEIFHQESNIIAYQVASPTHKRIYVDGKCFKCAKTFVQHEENRTSTDDLYFCVHCNDKFLTCTSLLKHEGTCYRNPARPSVHEMLNTKVREYPCKVCDVVFLTKPAQLEHLNVCHTVRSDDPIATGTKICKLCKKIYHIYNHHVCPKKNVLHECRYCGGKFQSKLMLDSHMKLSNQLTCCTKCMKWLQKSCMAPEHYARHSENFQIMHRCLPCKKLKLFSSSEAMRQHRLKNHSKIIMARRPGSDKIPIPKIMIEKCIDSRYRKNEQAPVKSNKKITHLSKKVLRNRYMCIEHFHSKYISKTKNGIRKRLASCAVPNHYAGEEPPSPPPEAPENKDPILECSPFLQINKPLKTYSRLRPNNKTVSKGESSQNEMHNKAQSNLVNRYDKVKEKSYKPPSRRNTDEEKNVDVESNITGKEVVNKMDKMYQMAESFYLDDEDVKHDVTKVLEDSVDPLEIVGHVESCTAIKQEPLEIETEYDVQKPDDTQNQTTEQVKEEHFDTKSNTDEVHKVWVKVENVEPEETQKDGNDAEIKTKTEQVYQTKFEEDYPGVQIIKPKTPPEKLPDKTPTRIRNTEIANTVVSECKIKLEIKPEPDND